MYQGIDSRGEALRGVNAVENDFVAQVQICSLKKATAQQQPSSLLFLFLRAVITDRITEPLLDLIFVVFRNLHFPVVHFCDHCNVRRYNGKCSPL